ncbi:hypothetical protein IM25_24915 (plasmid) [Rhodococcus sp. p52]|nr:hypothetical protein IM25_24915 [Rhodococcus sp. p52]
MGSTDSASVCGVGSVSRGEDCTVVALVGIWEVAVGGEVDPLSEPQLANTAQRHAIPARRRMWAMSSISTIRFEPLRRAGFGMQVLRRTYNYRHMGS